MHSSAQFALLGTIVASAIGAVVLCIVLLFYGFKSEPDDERTPGRRLLVIRLGHALAAACFAAALMLSTVALIDHRRVVARATTAAATSGEDVRRLAAHVDALEQRVAANELRLGDVETARAVAGAPVAAAPVAVESRPPAAPRVARPRKVVSVPPGPPAAARATEGNRPSIRESGETASGVPSTGSATSVSQSDGDPGAGMRVDWEAVKHGFRQAGRDIRSGFADLGRQVKRVFD